MESNPHFTDEETEARGGQIIWKGIELGSEPSLSSPATLGCFSPWAVI